MDEVYQQATGESLITNNGLFGGNTGKGIPAVWPISLILPSIAVIQVALVDMLTSLGIVPDAIVGHSAGETAMLYASGAASKAMVVEIAVARGKALSIAERVEGTMAALSCGAKDAQLIVDAATGGSPEGKLEIACYNAHDAVTLAGLTSFVEKAVEIARERGFFATKLRTRVAIHSSIMDVCRMEYERLVSEVFTKYSEPHTAKVKMYSTLTGSEWTEEFTADYYWQTTRNPVQFTQAMTAILEATPNATFLELSPHPVLSSYMSALGAQEGSVVCPMRRAKDSNVYHEQATLLDCIGRLIARGHSSVDFSILNGTERGDNTTSDVSYPSYPFVRKHVAYFPDSSHFPIRQLQSRNGPLNGRCLKVNSLTHPDLAQHVIRGEPIMPAAGFLEMVRLQYLAFLRGCG